MSIILPANSSDPPHNVKRKQKDGQSQGSVGISESGSGSLPIATGSASVCSQFWSAPEREDTDAHARIRKSGFVREVIDNSPRVLGDTPTCTESMEYDEYGAELGKEARVWKVYVKEADRWDAELVEGWNKSLDVILVFAALFAAVATAFLIESSKRLLPDPAEASAKTLHLISQTLLAMASKDQTIQPEILPSLNKTLSFEPTQHAIIINTLWYLSLSLSIATSLMAMCAKNWCHSFITNRQGDPWLQARRRQQKWIMIERWKMQELLLILPSLIHLSLLFFAAGLSIYVHDLNSAVAIPVTLVTTASTAFYLFSSAMACIYEFFPYTTILSKVLRSDFAHNVIRLMAWLGWNCIKFLCRFIKGCLSHSARFLMECPLCPCTVISFHIGLSTDRGLSYNRMLSFVKSTLVTPVFFMLSYIQPWVPAAKDLNSSFLHYTSYIQALEDSQSGQDMITSLALSWLISNCKTPSSVSIALQAIAGANGELPWEPLEQCQATLHILRRLVSSNLGNSEGLSFVQTSLYSRALGFLGDQVGNTRELELGVMVWDLQVENEKQVVRLITQEQFIPSDHNLQALCIGSSAASTSLRLLNEGCSNWNAMLNPLNELLSQHFDGS
ncbi:transmembrane protein, putative [Rhizoctonia solani AG-3 Rhs1AP]|uniref:Transmembrane protein, putative n=1 Tax=Rhizoctonia solani AG-3 Rhs1AP TaxID=1086054 RepID=X8JIQ0_9AGAM|nr:transmembrane protein, putative [Rhizoctonia solani AG-3 Rhs1AP]